jgi:hypothetical protein
MKIWWKFVQIGCIFRGCSVCLPERVLILSNLVSIVSEFKDLDGIIYLKAVQARMAKIFNDFHFQIFVFNSWPKKQHSLYKKSAGNFLVQKKCWGWGLFHLTRPLATTLQGEEIGKLASCPSCRNLQAA